MNGSNEHVAHVVKTTHPEPEESQPRALKRFRLRYFWFSILIPFVAGPIAVLETAAGHGTYVPLVLFFPHTIATWWATSLFDQSGVYVLFCCGLMILAQFPIYGLVLDWARARGRTGEAALFLAIQHFFAAILWGGCLQA